MLDFDDKVRTQAVVVACDLARSNLKIFPPELIVRATERLRDKKVILFQMFLSTLVQSRQNQVFLACKSHADIC